MMSPHLQGARLEAMAIEAAAPYLPELKRALPEAAPLVASTHDDGGHPRRDDPDGETRSGRPG